jgi:putative PIN family toxin of toxin-antitoxin system
MTRVVLDTNVLVPGFVGSASASARLIDLWRSGVYQLIVSEHVLAELERAFADPYYAARVSSEQARRILALLRTEAFLTPLTVSVSGVATQPKDDLVLSTGLSGDASYLATRDRQLLKLERYQGLVILHPADLLDMLMNASS